MIIKFLKDILSPKKCYSCKEEGHFLCQKCFDKIEKKYFFDEICYVCKKYSKNFKVHEKCKNNVFYDKTIILSHYNIPIVKKLIKDFKFYGVKDIGEDLSEFLIYKIIKYMGPELKKYKKNDFLIVSTPMSFFRKLKRGYNHSDIIAKHISNKLGFYYQKDLIIKNKNTRQQSKLNRQQRLKNLHNSFKVKDKHIDKIDKKIILLIDDVISTGATINEISGLLKSYNSKKIISVSIASG